MEPPLRIAVLLTAHNRRDETVGCLDRLGSQSFERAVHVTVVLVDDGSTDGTSPAVRERFPEVEIIGGSGHLYWNGGMRRALAHARTSDFDFYVLLNDDTHLVPDAIARLLATYADVARDDRELSIVIGATKDPSTSKLSYGGLRRTGVLNRAVVSRIEPSSEPQRCDTMNGNAVLIPRGVLTKVGSLDPGFTHHMGDLDYGFRAEQCGCSIWLAPGYVGTCAFNRGEGGWRDHSLGVRERWRRLLGPKGAPPREWLLFTSRHSGVLWPVFWASPYIMFWWRALARSITRTGSRS